MVQDGAYGRRLANAFHVPDAPTFITRSLEKSLIAVTEINCTVVNNQLTAPVELEDAFLLKLQMRDLPKRMMWRDGKFVRSAPMKAGASSIFDLRRSWIGNRVCPFHSLSFYLPRQALNDVCAVEGVPQIDHFDGDPLAGTDDMTIASLGRSLLPAFAKPNEANQLFVDHVTSAIAVHIVRTYGTGRKASKRGATAFTPVQEQSAKDLLMANLAGEISVAELAAGCGLSISAFNAAFTRSFGMTPHRWLLQQRVIRAMALLRHSDQSLTEIAAATGFADVNHLTRVFKSKVGAAPSVWLHSAKH